jgi:hypothetical protein
MSLLENKSLKMIKNRRINKFTIEISSRIKSNWLALSVNNFVICCETSVRCDINSLASN